MKRDHQTFSQQEREEIMTAIQRGLAAGKRVAITARERGITQAIFYRWVREGARERDEAFSLVPKREPVPGTVRSRRRFTPQERKQLLDEVRRRLAAGASVATATQELGLSESCWYNWTCAEKSQSVPLRPVEIIVPVALPSPSAPTSLSLVVPGGYRLEGLSIEAAVALLKALA